MPAIYDGIFLVSYTKNAEEEKQEETPMRTRTTSSSCKCNYTVPPLPQPPFIAPLKVTLKGIIIVANEDNKNRAMIADNTTNKESLYKVEDIVEDARLIKILHNKVIFLRANGQQEVLYLRQKDAELDPVYTPRSSWQDVIERVNGNTFMIHTDLFVDRVTNLAQCIDLLDLITVYQKGKVLDVVLALLEIILLVKHSASKQAILLRALSDIPTTDTENRMKIYKKIINYESKRII